MEAVVLTSPGVSLQALRELTAWADKIELAYAWASSNKGTDEHWLALPLQKLRRAVIGVHFAQTEPHVLHTLRARPHTFRLIEDTAGVFHPKVIVGVEGEEARALIGSSNFTRGGFSGNTELNVLLKGGLGDPDIQQVVEFVEAQWFSPRSFSPDAEWLARYETAYALRPTPPRLPKPTWGVAVVRSSGDLDVDWDTYYAFVAAQERRTLANGAEIHVFDHEDGSYLEEAERCQEAFGLWLSFATMPLDRRQLVAGWGNQSAGYFGRMTGAGYFKQLVRTDPQVIAEHLDLIPLTGEMTRSLAGQYLRGMLSIKGVSLATATRLLSVKRQDRFVPFNGANKSRIREIFGRTPETVDGYLDLHAQIWSMPWVDAPRPAEVSQQRVWSARVALLDAFMYEAPSSDSPPPGRDVQTRL